MTGPAKTGPATTGPTSTSRSVTGTTTAADDKHQFAGDATSVAALRAESARLLAEHQALRAEIEPRAAARELAMREAFDSQRAAHDAETRTWNDWSVVRDARRADPHDLSLVAAADQAEAAYEEARRAAKIAAREASAIARRARDESARDNARLSGLGMKCRAAQDRYRAATRALPADQ